MAALVEKPKPAVAPSTLGVVGRYILTPRIFYYLQRIGAGAGGEIQLTDGIAERTPKTRASYEAVATTPRWPTPPTTTGRPRSDGLSRCSTEA